MFSGESFNGCGFTSFNSKGECFRSYDPNDSKKVYIRTYIETMEKASVTSNFKVKKLTKKRQGCSSLHDSSSSFEDVSMPDDVYGNYNSFLTKIRDHCLMFMKRVADDAYKEVADLWFDRMHEPRLIHNEKFGFSESLANWFYRHFDGSITLVFSQSGFCINVLQLMLTFKALINASDSESHGRELIVYALESDPKVIGI
jgi:hypothetical protein